MTEKIEDGEDVGLLARQLLGEVVSALAVALGAAALTVAALYWVSTWEDVETIALPAYLIVPLAIAALVLQAKAFRIRQPSERR